ncbi:MAG TPA: hypothetical protein VFD84_08115 [Candidatus Binatia bacterium]|nr:hypothetical protein [Candidatus Binatia bacterium]
MAEPPLICPHCRVPMNHHADKAVPPTTAEEAARVDPALGGVVHEVHTCPQCGAGGTRPGR